MAISPGSAIIKGWKARKIMLAGAKEVPSGNAHVRSLTKQGDIIDLKRDLSHLPNKPLKVIRIKGTVCILKRKSFATLTKMLVPFF